MREIEVFEDSTLSPEKRVVAEEAFEAAWAKIECRFIGEEDSAYARQRLAGILRMIARQQIISRHHLTQAALVVFERHSD